MWLAVVAAAIGTRTMESRDTVDELATTADAEPAVAGQPHVFARRHRMLPCDEQMRASCDRQRSTSLSGRVPKGSLRRSVDSVRIWLTLTQLGLPTPVSA